jgi:hypothetical protein
MRGENNDKCLITISNYIAKTLEALVWQCEKEEKDEEKFLYNKATYNKINKGHQKTSKLCHTVKSRILARQLPLSWEEVTILVLLVHCLPLSSGIFPCIKPML